MRGFYVKKAKNQMILLNSAEKIKCKIFIVIFIKNYIISSNFKPKRREDV